MNNDKRLDEFPESQPALEALDYPDAGPEPKRRSRRRSPARHAARCKVCHHPEREAIEQDFLRWHSPEKIARDYAIPDHSSVYRHAHANGLFTRRNGQLRPALESIIERASEARVTGRDVINAIRAASCLTDDGKWVEPPRKVIYTTERPSHSGSEPPATPIPILNSQILNSQPGRIEHDATH